MIMEYFPGRTLGEYVRRGRRFEVAEIVAIGVALCGILDHVHSVHGRNVILTDIQPDNLVWHRNILRLIDLGDYATGVGNHIGKLRGTPGFVAPEVYEGGDICEATEVFAVGRVLQYLLTGRTVHGGSICAARHGIRRRGGDDVFGYVRYSSLVRIVTSCTCADIGRRPQCARELMERLLMVLRAHSPGK